MKILVICAGDRSQYSIALESIKYLKNTKFYIGRRCSQVYFKT